MNNNNSSRIFKFTKENNASISSNHQFKFAQQYALNLYSSNSIFTFIPKNACTTMRASIAHKNGFFQENESSEILKNRINWVHNNSHTFSANIRELATAQYTFTILRCPLSRLISMFLDKFVDKTPVAWNFFRQSNNRFDPDDISFYDFVHLLREKPFLINSDIHWRKQVDYLIYEKYDDYFDFDNFNFILETLKLKIGLSLLDTRNITNHGQEKYTKLSGDYSKTPVKELKLLKLQNALPAPASLYTDDLKNLIENFYQEDIKLRKTCHLHKT